MAVGDRCVCKLCHSRHNEQKTLLKKYIEWARRIGFASVRFRKQNGDIAPTPVEELYKNYKRYGWGLAPCANSITIYPWVFCFLEDLGSGTFFRCFGDI